MKQSIASIRIGERFRRDLGDLAGLAKSIQAQGLLHPIGITKEGELIFGERRLRACRDLLGWSEIEANVVPVTSIAAAEWAENVERQDFRPSERVALGEFMEQHLGERRGKPPRKHIPPKTAEYNGKETREIAGSQVGLGHTTYQSAKRVVKKGVPELVEAMDAGALSIYAAGAVAQLPPDQQQAVLAQGHTAIMAAVTRRRHARATKTDADDPIRHSPRAKHSATRLDHAVTTLQSVTSIVSTLDLAQCREAGQQRLAFWAHEISDSVRRLRRFQQSLGHTDP